MTYRIGLLGLIVWTIVCGAGVAPTHSSEQPPPVSDLSGVARVQTLDENGGRVSWGPRGRLAYDLCGPDGYYDVWTMQADGSDRRCLTCAMDAVIRHHVGQSAWHAEGRFLAAQVENPELEGYSEQRRGAGVSDFLETPGIGINNDIWILSADGAGAWPVTRIKSRLATLHPHFSSDGRRLVWAEAIERGWRGLRWAIKLADFDLRGNVPQVRNIRTLRPGDFALYETHGFTPNGRSLIFSASPGSRDYFALEIYRYDLQAGRLVRLTDDEEWDEHAHVSPDGNHIVWMSSRGIPQPRQVASLLTDYWIMRLDGSGARRLTYFNSPQAKEYVPGGVVAGDMSWAPDGRSFAAYLILAGERDGQTPDMRRHRLARVDLRPEALQAQ